MPTATKTTKEKPVIKTEADVAKILHGRYASPEWAFLTTVRNQTGFTRDTRTADAFAMNLFPSRGFERNGFEIKVSRSDVMHELNQPQKSEEIQRFCHKWWLVISDPKIIEGLTIPITWGVIDVSKGKCTVLKKAPDLKAVPLTTEFVASLLRNVVEKFVHPEDVAEKVAYAETMARNRMERGYQDYENLLNQVRDFEKESGITISNGWDKKHGGDIGKVVKFVLDEKKSIRYRTECLVSDAKRIVEQGEKLLKNI